MTTDVRCQPSHDASLGQLRLILCVHWQARITDCICEMLRNAVVFDHLGRIMENASYTSHFRHSWSYSKTLNLRKPNILQQRLLQNLRSLMFQFFRHSVAPSPNKFTSTKIYRNKTLKEYNQFLELHVIAPKLMRHCPHL